jgi:hypothetical protein
MTEQYRPVELSRALTEALFVAQQATESEAVSLKSSMETDEKCVGHVRMVVEQKMHECFEAVQVIRDTIKRRGHRDVVKRLREHESWLRVA